MFAPGSGDGGSFWSDPRKAADGHGALVEGRGITGLAAPLDGMDSCGIGNASDTYLDINSSGGGLIP